MPSQIAWVASDDIGEVRPETLGPASPRSSEKVTVTYPSPQQAVLDVELDSPGLVVLADVNYPGWQLTIDGQPAKIYRVNQLMRGALVPAKHHRLVYTFTPRSFQVGLVVSCAGLASLLLFGLFCTLRPVDPMLAAASLLDSPTDLNRQTPSTDQREVTHENSRSAALSIADPGTRPVSCTIRKLVRPMRWGMRPLISPRRSAAAANSETAQGRPGPGRARLGSHPAAALRSLDVRRSQEPREDNARSHRRAVPKGRERPRSIPPGDRARAYRPEIAAAGTRRLSDEKSEPIKIKLMVLYL